MYDFDEIKKGFVPDEKGSSTCLKKSNNVLTFKRGFQLEFVASVVEQKFWFSIFSTNRHPMTTDYFWWEKYYKRQLGVSALVETT